MLRAVLFDLDGVLTPTAELHMRAWERLFAPFCAARGLAPYTDADYFAHIDGKPRFDGVHTMLASRGVELPWGSTDDAPGESTVCALGNEKNQIVNAMFVEEGIDPYPGSVRFLDAVTAAGAHVAVVSSSRNAPSVLAAAGIADRFEVVVDGAVAERDGLPGKPAPDTYLRAAELLGVDRGVGPDALLAAGADLVVSDLGELDASILTRSAGPSAGPAEGSSARTDGGEQ